MSRKINKTQSQNLLHYFLFDPNIYTSLVITLEKKGDVKAEDVKNAVEKAYTQNETTMSRLVLENGEVFFEVMPETGCKVGFDNRDWMDIIHENEKKTFRINEGEFVRTFIKEDKNEIRLLIMVHHVFGDGYSMVLLTQDILNNLAGESVDFKPLNNDNQEPVPTKISYPFSKKIGIKLLNSQWKKTGKPITWEDYYKIHEAYWKNRQSYVEPAVLTEKLSEVKAKCKDLGITINSYMVAKQLEKNTEYKLIGIPRSARGENRSISNKVIVIKMQYTYDIARSFEENAKEIHACIQGIMKDPAKKYSITKSFLLFDPTLVDGAMLAHYTDYKNEMAEKMISILGMCGENKTQVGITNIGEVALKEEYDTFSVQNLLAVAAPMSTTEDAVAVWTFKDKIQYCFSTVK